MKNYYLFLDESGHHGLKQIDQEFPVMVLCGCIFEKDYYDNAFTKEFNDLKKKYFNNEKIIFHSRDIRKWQKDFKILGDVVLRNEFYNDWNNLVSKTDFKIIASVILKNKLIQEYGARANNPYSMSLQFILERTVFYTDQEGSCRVSIVAEARGKKEDGQLHQQYQLILSNGSSYVKSDRFTHCFTNIDFKKKEENVLGTQLCDLVAYPIATKVLYPDRKNFAFDVVEPKLYRQFPNGDYLGYGLKIFP